MVDPNINLPQVAITHTKTILNVNVTVRYTPPPVSSPKRSQAHSCTVSSHSLLHPSPHPTGAPAHFDASQCDKDGFLHEGHPLTTGGRGGGVLCSVRCVVRQVQHLRLHPERSRSEGRAERFSAAGRSRTYCRREGVGD